MTTAQRNRGLQYLQLMVGFAKSLEALQNYMPEDVLLGTRKELRELWEQLDQQDIEQMEFTNPNLHLCDLVRAMKYALAVLDEEYLRRYKLVDEEYQRFLEDHPEAKALVDENLKNHEG